MIHSVASLSDPNNDTTEYENTEEDDASDGGEFRMSELNDSPSSRKQSLVELEYSHKTTAPSHATTDGEIKNTAVSRPPVVRRVVLRRPGTPSTPNSIANASNANSTLFQSESLAAALAFVLATVTFTALPRGGTALVLESSETTLQLPRRDALSASASSAAALADLLRLWRTRILPAFASSEGFVHAEMLVLGAGKGVLLRSGWASYALAVSARTVMESELDDLQQVSGVRAVDMSITA
jgi:hypothetical protein